MRRSRVRSGSAATTARRLSRLSRSNSTAEFVASGAGAILWRRLLWRGGSVEAKALGAHEGAEIGALRHAVLAGLVFRPAVEIGLAPSLRRALPYVLVDRGAAAVVGVDAGSEIALIVAVAVQRDVERQARTDVACLRRPADTHAGYRNDAVGKLQHVAHARRMVADDADRAAAEPDRFGGADEGCEHDAGVDGRVEELVEVIVRERLAAKLGDPLQAPAIGEKDQEDRRGDDPRHIGDQLANRSARRVVTDNDNVALLQVALRRRRERAGA